MIRFVLVRHGLACWCDCFGCIRWWKMCGLQPAVARSPASSIRSSAAPAPAAGMAGFVICNSVLRGRLARAASQYMTSMSRVAQMLGKSSSGRILPWCGVQTNEEFCPAWTYEGAETARSGINFQLLEKSTARWFMNTWVFWARKSLSKKQEPMKERKWAWTFCSSLSLSKKSMLTLGEECLRRGYFREEPLSKMLDEATLVMEGNFQDDTCNFGNFKHQCP